MILTLSAIKGGCGKTSTAAVLAQAAAIEGERVLAIDLDPQGNLSYCLKADRSKWGSYELLDGADISATIQHTDQGVDVIAGSPDLAGVTSRPGSANRLREALAPIRDGYRLIVIDTPPQMGELVYNALQAATDLLIPLEADRSSIDALTRITAIAKTVQQTNPELQILGTVITRYDRRANVNRLLLEYIEQVGEKEGVPLLGTIRQGVAVKEAMAMQRPLFEYAYKSKPADDYRELYQVIMRNSR